MSRFLKIFLLAGTIMAAVMGTLYGLVHEFPLGMIAGIVAGYVAGALLAMGLWLFQKAFAGHGGAAKGSEHVKQRREIEIPFPYAAAFDLCRRSLSVFGNYTLLYENAGEGKINARTGVTMKSWGDHVSFTLRSINDHSTRIEIRSEPLLKTTIVDFGKNFENVEAICSFLLQHQPPSER